MKKLLKGFTLIELMIVVAIIGILAAIAIPNFVKFQCRSKQSEAKGNLKALYVAEEAYRGEFDTYLATGSAIGFIPKGTKIRYTYAIAGNTATVFGASATANTSDLSSDAWQITQRNDLTNTTNGCL
ncbi:MAG: prepilin-type N-terminal cleavage/methylation domain-containing protein [Deltaproteobacteria bacterium]|nr:prepilin-type N-terminal cleavage/methylation domain-containing protein [Deltaproteobacteria bacterium]